MNIPYILTYLVIAVAIVSLFYGSYTDVRNRTVKSLLFLPLALSGFGANYFLHVPTLYLYLGIAIFFLFFFFKQKTAYEIVGAAFFVVAIIVLYLVGFYWGFQLLIIAIIFLLGFQERLFGIGDIKAIVAIMYASSFYSPFVSSLVGGRYDYGVIPTSLTLLVDISIFAVAFLVYALYLLSRHGTVNIAGQPMAIRYDAELAGKNPAAYRMGEKDGTRYLVYRIPFIVPITLGYILFLTIGFIPFTI